MFHSDISFTTKEKAVQFGEDAKNFMTSYKDALDFLKEKAFQDYSKENYINNAKNLVNNLKSGHLIYTKLFDMNKSYFSPLIPSFQKDDEKLRLANHAYGIFTKYFLEQGKPEGKLLQQTNDFESLSQKLDQAYEDLSKK